MAIATRAVLELGGITVADLTAVTGLSFDREFIETKQIGADGQVVIRRIPGAWRPGEVALTRPSGSDQTFHAWVQAGDVAPGGTGAIVLFDDAGAVARRYVLSSPWVRRLELTWQAAGAGATVLETLVISYERVDAQ